MAVKFVDLGFGMHTYMTVTDVVLDTYVGLWSTTVLRRGASPNSAHGLLPRHIQPRVPLVANNTPRDPPSPTPLSGTMTSNMTIINLALATLPNNTVSKAVCGSLLSRCGQECSASNESRVDELALVVCVAPHPYVVPCQPAGDCGICDAPDYLSRV